MLHDEVLAKDFKETVELSGEKEANGDNLKEDNFENKNIEIIENSKISEKTVEQKRNEQVPNSF